MTKDQYATIAYPSEYSETDVQFRLMSSLDALDLDFRSEVKVEPKFGSRGARLDVVVFFDEIAIAIIEVKKKDYGTAKVQQKHYHELTGLPVFVCGGMLGIKDTVANVLSITNNL